MRCGAPGPFRHDRAHGRHAKSGLPASFLRRKVARRSEEPSRLPHDHRHRVATILGVIPAGRLVFAAALTKAQRDKLTPDDIVALMKKGNERFPLGTGIAARLPRPAEDQRQGSVPRGRDPEMRRLPCAGQTIMDLGIGDCFNARVAGNIANDDILGSMEFACKVAGAKVVLVMGHSGMRRDQGRDRQGQARQAYRAARQDPPRGGGDLVSGRTLGEELWFRGRGGAQECRVDHGRNPSAQCRPGRARNLGWGETRGSDVQPRNGAGRVLRLTRLGEAARIRAIAIVTGLTTRVRMPFYLTPGDLLFLSPSLPLFAGPLPRHGRRRRERRFDPMAVGTGDRDRPLSVRTRPGTGPQGSSTKPCDGGWRRTSRSRSRSPTRTAGGPRARSCRWSVDTWTSRRGRAAGPGMTKNDQGRVVYLRPELKALLAAQVERVERSSAPRPDHPFLFPYLPDAGGRARAGATSGRRGRRRARTAGVAGRFRHDFRRTAVRNLVNARGARAGGHDDDRAQDARPCSTGTIS